jgi:hypothetical protein
VDSLRAVADSPADGVMVYHWVGFLEDELLGDGRRVEALRAFKAGTLQGSGLAPGGASAATSGVGRDLGPGYAPSGLGTVAVRALTDRPDRTIG